ncbi:MAG: (Fe-S)-binding protein [Nitrospirae bacterium]|nr:(Fe-S)-binding protein [Nitrospirota bacterium]
MESSQYLDELSKCVRCGSCKAFCPTYEEDSTESMSARGRLALLWALSSGQITSSHILNDRIFGCMLCGKCEGLCPLAVDIKEVIYHGRTLLKKKDNQRKYLRFFTKLFIKKPGLTFKLLSAIHPVLFPYLLKKGTLPFRIELPERHLKDRPQVFTVTKKRGRVAVFTGCVVNFLYPHLGEALINVLLRLGYEIVLPANEVCCGMPLRTLGLEEEAVNLAKRNIETFKRLNVEAVLSLCPSCTLALKTEYPKLIGEGIDKAKDISSFFIDKIDPSRFTPSSDSRNAIYHDPCHLKYGLGIEREPREIIEKIGINLIRTEGDRCCGFAGLFCLSFMELSRQLLNKCTEEYTKAGGEVIITSCPGCIMQLSNEIKDKPVIHLIEAIEEALFQEK